MLAISCLAQIAIGFLGVPSSLTHWIVCGDAVPPDNPQYAIVLGGGGIPSESGLMRTYYAAELIEEYDDLKFIVALPSDNNPEEDSVGRMKNELIMRGVPTNAVMMETRGLNTHQQAVNIRAMLGEDALDEPLIIVSSPTHIRRAVLCFQKEGFTDISSVAAHRTGAEADLGSGTELRYAFWSRLQHALEVCRELTALGVYKFRGWI